MDKRTVMAGLLAAVAIACSDAAGELAGSMMRDVGETMLGAGVDVSAAGMGGLGGAAGELLADAGQVLVDAGTGMLDAGAASGAGSDAQAQPAEPTVLEGACNVESGYVFTPASGEATGFSIFYAEIDVAGRSADDLAGASVVLCDWEPFEPHAVPCAGTATCEEIGTYPASPGDCEIGTSFKLDAGKAIIVCGDSSTSSGTTYGGHWKGARLIVLP